MPSASPLINTALLTSGTTLRTVDTTMLWSYPSSPNKITRWGGPIAFSTFTLFFCAWAFRVRAFEQLALALSQLPELTRSNRDSRLPPIDGQAQTIFRLLQMGLPPPRSGTRKHFGIWSAGHLCRFCENERKIEKCDVQFRQLVEHVIFARCVISTFDFSRLHRHRAPRYTTWKIIAPHWTSSYWKLLSSFPDIALTYSLFRVFSFPPYFSARQRQYLLALYFVYSWCIFC